MEESIIQQFLRVYRITPNPNTISGISPAELIVSRKNSICVWPTLAGPGIEKKITEITKKFKNMPQSISDPETKSFFLKFTLVQKNSGQRV